MHSANERFIERLGLFFERDGGPRIGGRMLGFLLLSPEECSLDDLAEQLQVSKASVSTNARMLEGWGMVERVSHPGDRRDYYRIAADMQRQMLERRLERMKSLRDLIEEGRHDIPIRDEQVKSRLRTLSEFQTHAIQGMEEGLQRLRSCQRNGAGFSDG